MDGASGPRIDLQQVPHGHTARRLTWPFLPPDVRTAVEERLGSKVAEHSTQDAGFTPGFASILTGEDGSTVFVKAASTQAQADGAAALTTEATTIAALPDGVPAPRPAWTLEADGWVVTGFETYAGRLPERPWREDDLERALDLLEQVADALDPVPPALGLRPLLDEMPLLARAWPRVQPVRAFQDDAVDLVMDYADLPATAFVHTDVRDDNVLLGDDGSALLVDWGWCALGQPWQDTVDLLVSAYGDGIDVDAVLARRRLTRDVDPAHIDAWLAVQAGFMALASSRRPPMNSPYLGAHGRWYAAALWEWLCDRRDWR